MKKGWKYFPSITFTAETLKRYIYIYTYIYIRIYIYKDKQGKITLLRPNCRQLTNEPAIHQHSFLGQVWGELIPVDSRTTPKLQENWEDLHFTTNFRGRSWSNPQQGGHPGCQCPESIRVQDAQDHTTQEKTALGREGHSKKSPSSAIILPYIGFV